MTQIDLKQDWKQGHAHEWRVLYVSGKQIRSKVRYYCIHCRTQRVDDIPPVEELER